MRILKVPPYCEPEQLSSSHLTKNLEESYIENGWEILKIAPTPSRGVSASVREEYKKILHQEKYEGKLIIKRFPMYKEPKNSLLRAFRYIICHFIQYFKAVRYKDMDIILGGSTPPTQGILCSKIKKKLNIPFVYSLQDMFPESLVSSGITRKGSLIWKIGDALAKKIYKAADAIIVISESMRRSLINKGVEENKVTFIPNWIDTQAVHPVEDNENELFEEFSISRDKFRVVYAGNLGLAQGTATILDAASLLKDNKNIEFVIFGGGAEEQSFRERAADLDNVSFYPLQPQSKVSQVYSLGNICLVCGRKKVGESAVPSKTWSIMASGRTVVASFDIESELCDILRDNNCGFCVAPEDAKALGEVIEKLSCDEATLAQCGENGRKYAVDKLSRQSAVSAYARVIESVLNKDTKGRSEGSEA